MDIPKHNNFYRRNLQSCTIQCKLTLYRVTVVAFKHVVDFMPPIETLGYTDWYAIGNGKSSYKNSFESQY